MPYGGFDTILGLSLGRPQLFKGAPKLFCEEKYVLPYCWMTSALDAVLLFIRHATHVTHVYNARMTHVNYTVW